MNEIEIENSGVTLKFSEDQLITIGRATDALVSIDDKTVSRKHGELKFVQAIGSWVYTDLGSANGSFVNGLQVTTVEVKFPSTIRLGKQPDAQELRLSEIATASAIDERTITTTAIHSMTPTPIVEAAGPLHHESCSLCQKPINADFGPRCPYCENLIHKSCWDNQGGCASLGCPGNSKVLNLGDH